MTLTQIIRSCIRSYHHQLLSYKRKYPELFQFTQKRERPVIVFFFFLISLLLMRLFFLQILQFTEFDQKLLANHRSISNFKAQRGNIYVTDRSGAGLPLTENITLYTIYVEPPYIKDKKKVIEILTPIIYAHLCKLHGFDRPDKQGCMRNLEGFINSNLLPVQPEVMYYGSGVFSSGYDTIDWTGYTMNLQKTTDNFTTGQAYKLITDQLDAMIRIGQRDYNYIGYITDKITLDRLKSLQRDYLVITGGNYVYIAPTKVSNKTQSLKEVSTIFAERGFDDIVDNLEPKFDVQEYGYIKLISDVHPAIVDALNTLKKKYYKTTVRGIPLLHAVGTESYVKRYYPYHSFMSHIIGYLGDTNIPYYGIEEYFDTLLRGVDGRVEGRSSALMGQVGANDFTIKNVKNGYDVYLTIDPVIQRQIEGIATHYREKFKADSISVLVYNPRSGQLIASTNAPSFDPNEYNEIYRLNPVQPSQSYLLDDLSYIDFPVYIKKDGETRVATLSERSDPTLPKYVTTNPLGPNLFIDKNIAFPYEPGSIFKSFTYGIGLDIKEIGMYDQYADPNSEILLQVGNQRKNGQLVPLYKPIRNAEKEACRGTHTFLYALQHSCNVGMIRIVEKITRQVFYNYLEKLGFGSFTHVELAGEDPGSVPPVSSISRTAFFNNAFGQGLLTTPLQIAAAYGSLLNGGLYVKPTIIDKICESGTEKCQYNKLKVIQQIFDPAIAEDMRFSLVKVIELPVNGKYSDVPGYRVGGKSGTSQIAYKGKYRDGRGWTNGSYVGIITKDNLKYIVVIQVRRPRTSQWGNQTAGNIFRDTASFLINYEIMQGEKFTKKDQITDYSQVKDAGVH